jgi:hypothetical protein
LLRPLFACYASIFASGMFASVFLHEKRSLQGRKLVKLQRHAAQR